MMTAGPVEVSPRVLAALAEPTVHHYYPRFLELFQSTVEKMSRVFMTEKENVIVLQGEAVLGLEASVACTVNPGEKVLVFENGPFGRWFGEYVLNSGAVPVYFRGAPNQALDVASAKAFLDENRDAAAMTIVHCETPAGLINDIAPICVAAKRMGMLTIVDCVATLGGAPFHTTEWGVDIAITASQKCLSSAPGLAPMVVSPFAWQRMERKVKKPLRNSYLSLLDWRDSWITNHRFPFTPFTNDVYGLSAALDEILEEGLENCFSRHADAAAYCRGRLKDLDLPIWPTNERDSSPTVTAFHIPEGMSDSQVIHDLVSRHHILIGGGYKELKGQLLRIATMGYCANRDFVSATMDALQDVLGK